MSVPGLLGVALVDDGLDLTVHGSDPLVEVVLDVSHQALHAVVQELLPAGSAVHQPPGAFGLAPQLVDHLLGCLRLGQHLLLGDDLQSQLLLGEADISGDRRHGLVRGRLDDVDAQPVEQRREARLLVQLRQPQGPQPQERRHGHQRDVDPRGGEVLPVQLDDPPPLRVQVGLRDDADGGGTALERLAQELHLGSRQFLARVRHEDHPTCLAERTQRDHAVGRVQTSDPWRVDQSQPGAQEAVGQSHLDRAEPVPPVRLGGLGHQMEQLLDVHGFLHRFGLGIVGRRQARDGRGRRTIPDHRRHRRDDVGVDGADVGLEQGVDQRALPALELSHDGDAQDLPGQPLADPCQMTPHVRPVLLRGEPPALVQCRHDPGQPCRRRHHRLRDRRPVRWRDRLRPRGADVSNNLSAPAWLPVRGSLAAAAGVPLREDVLIREVPSARRCRPPPAQRQVSPGRPLVPRRQQSAGRTRRPGPCRRRPASRGIRHSSSRTACRQGSAGHSSSTRSCRFLRDR